MQHLSGKPFYFDDHVIGDEHAAGSHTLTAKEIVEFATQWDPQPWHVDEAVAQGSHFGGLTACSAHIFSIFCITSQRWQSGVMQQALAGLGFDEMRIHTPAYAEDTLRCMSLIDNARVSRSNPTRGIVIYHTKLLNQNDELVFSIKASTLLARDPARL